MDDPIRKCFTESRLNGLVLPNRLIKAATFEGKSPGGIPGPDLIRVLVPSLVPDPTLVPTRARTQDPDRTPDRTQVLVPGSRLRPAERYDCLRLQDLSFRS